MGVTWYFNPVARTASKAFITYLDRDGPLSTGETIKKPMYIFDPGPVMGWHE
jgi:hypothetical protein